MPVGFEGIQNELQIRQGVKGSGKTNSIKIDTAHLDTCFYVDIRNEYNHVPKVHSFNDFIKMIMQVKMGRLEEYRIHKLAFNFSDMDDYIKLFNALNCFQNTTLVVDEADALYNYGKFEQPLMNLSLGCRNNQVNLIFSCKRPFLLPIFIRTQADKIFVFRTNEQRDIKWLEDKAPLPKSPRKLDQGDCYIITVGNNQIETKHYEAFSGKVVQNV
jgi:hypothetical protein